MRMESRGVFLNQRLTMGMELDWINVHTHRPGRGINVVDPCLGNVTATGEGMIYFSAGIHPMYIDEDAGIKLMEIERAAVERRIVAVGEAGMDRNSPVSMEEQEEWFVRQADIAGRYGLPLIIHGVRTIPELISVYKRCRSHDKWIMHGFNNRKEILQDLLRHGFYISVGRHAMREDSNVYDLLPEIPTERLFIETDNSEFTIEEVYGRVAERRSVSVEQLKAEVFDNFKRLFPIGSF